MAGRRISDHRDSAEDTQSSGLVTATASSATDIPVRAQLANGQTAPAFQVTDASGNVVFTISPTGVITPSPGGGPDDDSAYLLAAPASLAITGTVTGTIPLTVTGASGQTAHLLEVHTSAGDVFFVTNHGGVAILADSSAAYALVYDSPNAVNDTFRLNPQGDVVIETDPSSSVDPLRIHSPGTSTIVAKIDNAGVGHFSALATTPTISTISLVSGTPAQLDTAHDRQLTVPITYNPTSGASATCAKAVSPDNVTYTTLTTHTVPLGVTFDGLVDSIHVSVPAGWWVRLTVVNAVIGGGFFY
jgi:hypothetical protein